jgi:hypothetical protein
MSWESGFMADFHFNFRFDVPCTEGFGAFGGKIPRCKRDADVAPEPFERQ